MRMARATGAAIHIVLGVLRLGPERTSHECATALTIVCNCEWFGVQVTSLRSNRIHYAFTGFVTESGEQEKSWCSADELENLRPTPPLVEGLKLASQFVTGTVLDALVDGLWWDAVLSNLSRDGR